MEATLDARLVAEANRLGFDAVGFARADVPLGADFAHYESFVAHGMHGEMQWLADLPEARKRLDGEHILPGAKTVVCLARRYGRAADPDGPIARYARGRDYHNGMRKKLRKLAAFARTLGAGVTARPLCDQEPILERAWAARSGLGFVGKNGLLIVPGAGSFVLLGEVVTTLSLDDEAYGTPMRERCGTCTRCLDACPTQAFRAPFVLDPRLLHCLPPRSRAIGARSPKSCARRWAPISSAATVPDRLPLQRDEGRERCQSIAASPPTRDGTASKLDEHPCAR